LPHKFKIFATTGLFTLDLATYFQPKKIYILGLDFYYSPYISKEKLQRFDGSKLRKKKMLTHYKHIVRREKDIHFCVYTKCKKVLNRGNVTVEYV